MSKTTDLQEQLKDKCLDCAMALLQSETAPTAAAVEVAIALAEVANSITEQDLLYALETRERREVCEDLGGQGREVLISRYESEIRQLTRRVEKLKAGASPADIIF